MPEQPSRNDSIQTVFGAVASHYTTSAVHASGADLEHIVRLTQARQPAQALDLGCGAGHVALNIAPYCTQVIAYDLTAPMLAQVNANATARNLTNIITQQGDVSRLPFGDRSFDVIATRYSAHHWHDPQSALEEVARVLKPDGIFILGDIVAPENPAEDTFLQTIELLRDPSHVRDHCLSQWVTMFKQARLEPSVAMNFDLTLHFDTWRTRIGTPDHESETLRRLMQSAPTEIRQRFGLPALEALVGDFPFVIQGALITAVLRG